MENQINLYGYARVSTKKQNLDRQIEALTKFGVMENNLFIDKKSGKNFDREEYQFLKKILSHTKNQKTLIAITSIDRLRSQLYRNKKGIPGHY